MISEDANNLKCPRVPPGTGGSSQISLLLTMHCIILAMLLWLWQRYRTELSLSAVSHSHLLSSLQGWCIFPWGGFAAQDPGVCWASAPSCVHPEASYQCFKEQQYPGTALPLCKSGFWTYIWSPWVVFTSSVCVISHYTVVGSWQGIWWSSSTSVIRGLLRHLKTGINLLSLIKSFVNGTFSSLQMLITWRCVSVLNSDDHAV